MDWMRYRDACMNFIRKYRYVVLVVAVGLVLMSIPSRKNEAEPPGRRCRPNRHRTRPGSWKRCWKRWKEPEGCGLC